MTAKCIKARRRSDTSRSCLQCRATFASAGAHERICPACKAGEEWQACAIEFPLAPVAAPPSKE